MQRPERSNYTCLDFNSWEEADTLSLSPKFQRRPVWSTSAKSFLIDTLLKGLPIPPIYLRIAQNKDRTRTIREVIDGQQRLRAVLDYYRDVYALSPSVSEEAPGKRFSQLTNEQQDAICTYGFICESFAGLADEQVLEIFSRLNTHSVKLNAQELRNGRYFGKFKRSVYKLALEHLTFWRESKIFTEQKIARMLEVELVSELVVAQMAGQQDKKISLDQYYMDNDEEFPTSRLQEVRFKATIDAITEALGDQLAASQFRRSPLFYTLYCVVFHRLFGLPTTTLPSPKSKKLEVKARRGLSQAVEKLSILIVNAKDGMEVPKKYLKFVSACLTQTDNIHPRETRFAVLYEEAFTQGN